MESIWVKSSSKVRFESLFGDKNTDVLIIGGGIAGILCAYNLKNAGVDFILTEAKEICSSVTKNTTAKITLQHGLIYEKISNRYGESHARLYLEAQIQAGKEYKRLCKNIDCDYEIKDSYVYSINDRKKIENEVDTLNKIGVRAELLDSCELPFEVEGVKCVKDQAQFNPLKFLYGIAEDLPIYEHTKVIELKPNKAITNNGIITFKKLIVATHFPILNKHGAYFLKLYQHRSYVLALKNAPHVDGMYVDESEKGLSFRSYGDILLLGGGSHRTGKQGGCWRELEEFAKKHYSNAQIIGKWATQDCMTLDGIPYIGQYSKSVPNVYVATGFNKWGITNAMVASEILCNLVCGKTNRYAEAFSPSRSVIHPQLCINIFESATGLLTPTVPRCPHLGCALKYNKDEHSWDCPCHGSRFSESGELIDNPATDDNRSIADKK